jgi:hypothetical protein
LQNSCVPKGPIAECFLSGTRQRASLPSAKKKHTAKKHSAKRLLCRMSKKTLGKDLLCQVFLLTLGKEVSLPSVFSHSKKTFFAE